MFPIFDLVMGLGGLIVSPTFNLIKRKLIESENDTPERKIGDLVVTKPEALPEYIEALTNLSNSKIGFFNRDIIGNPSQWVVNLRAAIRPLGVILSFLILGGMAFLALTGGYDQFIADPVVIDELLTGIRGSCELMISSWFGARITLKG